MSVLSVSPIIDEVDEMLKDMKGQGVTGIRQSLVFVLCADQKEEWRLSFLC
jgi:hypothetical protein